jgi:hypothetical protein
MAGVPIWGGRPAHGGRCFPLKDGGEPVIRLGVIVMILDLHRQGAGVSAIARRTGLDRKTVHKVIAGGLDPVVYGSRRRRVAQLQPFEQNLRERLAAAPELTGRRLHRELGALGYRGGYTAVTDLLCEIRPSARPPFEVPLPSDQINLIDEECRIMGVAGGRGVRRSTAFVTNTGQRSIMLSRRLRVQRIELVGGAVLFPKTGDRRQLWRAVARPGLVGAAPSSRRPDRIRPHHCADNR